MAAPRRHKDRISKAHFFGLRRSTRHAKFEYGSCFDRRTPPRPESAQVVHFERGHGAHEARSLPLRRVRCAPRARAPSAPPSFTRDPAKLLLRALNNVAQEFDPSAHAEVRAIRLATKRLKQLSLAGYTLYTTCEPCPMCMSTALWAGLDRVVYGATIEDANRHCNQIQIPATEVAARSDMQLHRRRPCSAR